MPFDDVPGCGPTTASSMNVGGWRAGKAQDPTPNADWMTLAQQHTWCCCAKEHRDEATMNAAMSATEGRGKWARDRSRGRNSDGTSGRARGSTRRARRECKNKKSKTGGGAKRRDGWQSNGKEKEHDIRNCNRLFWRSPISRRGFLQLQTPRRQDNEIRHHFFALFTFLSEAAGINGSNLNWDQSEFNWRMGGWREQNHVVCKLASANWAMHWHWQ